MILFLPVAIPRNMRSNKANIWPPGSASSLTRRKATSHINTGVMALTTTFSSQIGGIHSNNFVIS